MQICTEMGKIQNMKLVYSGKMTIIEEISEFVHTNQNFLKRKCIYMQNFTVKCMDMHGEGKIFSLSLYDRQKS